MNPKLIPTELRDHLSELTGNELKVWMSHYLHTGDSEPTCHLSNETVAKETGLNVDTVKVCKKSLIAKGWLTRTGKAKRPRKAGGTWDVPVMSVELPWWKNFTAVDPPWWKFTVVENFHLEGSRFGSIPSFNDGPSFASNPNQERAEALRKAEKTEPEPKSHTEGALPPATPAGKKAAEPPTGNVPLPARVGVSGKPKLAKDGTPFPEGFDGWRNAARLYWLAGHDPDTDVDLRELTLELKNRLQVARMRDDTKACTEIAPALVAVEKAANGSGVPLPKQNRNSAPRERLSSAHRKEPSAPPPFDES